MAKGNKFYSWACPYSVNVIVFLIITVLMKVILGIIHFEPDFTCANFFSSIAVTFIAAGILSFAVMLVYAICSLVSRRTSMIITSLLFAFLFLTEISLTIFTIKSGALMDNEIFLRPINEVVETIKSGMNNLLLVTIAFVIFITAYCFSIHFITKKMKFSSCLVLVTIIYIALSLSSACLMQRFEKTTNPNVRNYITNKTWYLAKSIFLSEKFTENKIGYDESVIDEYIEFKNGHVIPDKYYPMERFDNTKDNLSQYFKDSDIKPNIAIIVVESLGNEWMGTNNTVRPIMPFLDSLSKESLYWKNCMSTTLRSFGIVPAITGSVPCGIRGYQFGNMPETNTLIGILKSNGYETNAFYSGEFYFDCVAEYLISQKIDYMSNFYADYKKENDKNKGNFWGYHDEFLFDKSMEVLKNKKSPMMNLFVTISTHDDVEESNPVFVEAARKAKQIVEETRENSKVSHNAYKKSITFVYTDDCLRKLFADYSKRSDFENTIFVITGDHSSGSFMKSDISRYHVPLIIYSPLLKEHKTFDNVVTHNDFVPSLVTLLKNKYKLETPAKVSWAGNCLGIDEEESMSEMLFVEYAKGVTKMLSNGYMYVKEEDKTYRIDNDMSVTDASDDAYHEVIKRKFDVYKNVNDYVYLNNKLVSENIYEDDKYEYICQYNHPQTIRCQTREDKKWINFYMLPETKIPGEWNKIKICFSADVSFLDEIEADQYMDLYFYCSGSNHNYPEYYTDKIVKFFPVDKIETGEWYKLNVEKEFVVKDAADLKCYIYTYYSRMLDSNEAFFKNIKVRVYGSAN
ncbi:MAG: LTA synthase family protein [Bacteroidales bacterium]|nr:LTA synthase family protein [Bacteroidales bacterium]